MMDLKDYIEEIDRGYHTFREVCSIPDKYAIEKILLEQYSAKIISENALSALIQFENDCIKTGLRTEDEIPEQLRSLIKNSNNE